MTSLTRRVVVLMDSLEDDYQAGIVSGVLRAGALANVQLWCLAGGVVGAPIRDHRSEKNFLFDLLDPGSPSGIVAFSGALGNQLGSEALGVWLRRFARVPLVGLGPELPEYPCVSVDGGAGMRAALKHLIDVHGKRRIAFIRGPLSSVEGEERFAAYRATLDEAGIDFDERVVLEGNWMRESGSAAIRELLDVRRVNIELLGAVASANDYMALGALDELNARDIAVPETVALTGFDDLDTLRGVVPALTTVRQPTDELGAAGLQRLVSLMNGGEAGPGDKLAPELVVRRSCGCSVTRDSPRAPSSGLSLQATLVDRRALISAELSRSARGALFGVGSGWESRLLTTFLSDLTSPGATAFVGAVHGMLLRLSRNGVDPALLQPVLAQLRTAVYECAGSDPQGRVRASDLFEATRETLSEFLIRSETSRRVAALRQVRGFGAVVTSLLGAPPIEQVRAALTERFTALGVGAMAVGLFTEPGRVTEECLCVVAYNDAVSATPAERFRARDLCPPQLFAREKRPLLIQPLTFQGQPLGLVTTVLGSFENNVYEQLREALSAALYGYRLALARSVQS